VKKLEKLLTGICGTGRRRLPIYP